MSFDAFAVATRWGPHVTLQAGVVHLGRHWTTTARRSAKARAARRSGRAAATTVGRDGALHIVAGAVRVLDGSRPGSLLADPFTVGLAPGALARLAFGQLSQVLGYAEAATAVPVGWLPLGRVVLVTEISDELVVRAGVPVGGRGRWASGAGGGARDPAGAFGRPARGHSGDGVARSGGGARSGGADRRRGWPDDLPERLPPPVRALAGADGGCWVGVVTPAGVVAVPGRWCAGQRIAEVAAGVLDAVGADLGAGVCVTLDDSGERRPDRKVGCMLRATVLGRPLATAAGAVVRLEVACERVTWWQGFRSGTEHTFDPLH